MKLLLTFYTVLLFSMSLSAQTTGSFQKEITFMADDYNVTRTVYYHVPADYNPDQAYKLVFGFRGGPHASAGEFRDQLAFLSDSIDAIVVCPENIAHFGNQEELTKQLFRYTVDTVESSYSIDRDQIYLTGLSFGGRHAVIVSMDSDAGEIPRLRGVIPFAAGRESENRPNYENISEFPPACFCIGLADNSLFIDITRELHREVQNNNGHSFLNEISGVGHSTAFGSFPNEFMECYRYIESTYETTSIDGVLDDTTIAIFPNPSSGNFRITINSSLNVYRINIVDSVGNILREIDPSGNQIDVFDLPIGPAYLVVKTDKGVFKKAFVVR